MKGLSPELEARLERVRLLTSQERRARKLELVDTHRRLHSERVDIGVETACLSYLETIESFDILTSAPIHERKVIEITPGDKVEVDPIIHSLGEMGYRLAEVICDRDTFKVYAVFQKE